MLAKHPSNTRANVKKDEIIIIDTVMTAKNMSTDISERLTPTMIEERVKAAAKLEGVSTDKILARNKKAMITPNNTSVTTNVSRNNVDRLSKESGIGSSVGSSLDERDDEVDYLNIEQFTSSSSQSTTNTSVSIENPKISPIVNQSFDDLDDNTMKLPGDNKKSLGIITEEEESYNNSLNNNISHSNHYHDNYNNNNNSFFKKYHQNRITFSDNLDSNSEVTESSTYNDTESSTSGEPDSPALLNNLVQVNNSPKIELERKKNSFKRKNSGRSIFSVLSSSSLLSSSSSSSLQRGSLSDPEDSFPNHQRLNSPGSPKSDRILVRSGFSSLSIKKRRSKTALSIAASDSKLNFNSNNNSKMTSTGLSTSRPGSPENENLSKAGKILGLTVSEEKILLDNKVTTKKSRDVKTTSFSSDEKIKVSKANKILGYNDNKLVLSKSSKASKILGLDDNDSNRRSPSMYVDKEFRGNMGSQTTVASIKKNVICKGFLAKYTNTSFVLSKSWKRRYFILARNTLYCFKSSDNNSQLLDQFELTADSVVCVSDNFNGKSWVLQVGVGRSNQSNQKTWYIQADNVEDMKAWLTELKSIVVKCNHAPETPSYPNSTDKLLLYDDDDDDDDNDYDDIDDLLNDNQRIHQRAFSSPSKFVQSPKLSSVKPVKPVKPSSSSSSSSSNVDHSLQPPIRTMPSMSSMMTSLPPPPRPKSAPSSPSCPPSPVPVTPATSLSPPPRQTSPHSHTPADVEELGSINNDDFEILPRSSSPVETLSPPRARFGGSIQSHQYNSSISSTYSTNSITPPSRNKHRSNSANSSLSINTTSLQKHSSPRQSPVSPPANNSPRKSIRNFSTSSHRESIPIMMPSWGLMTTSPTSMSNPNFLSPPPRPLPSRNIQQMPYKLSEFYAHLPNPPKPPEGPKPPARNTTSINFNHYLAKNPPPNIPLPQPPPRPTNTLTSASRVINSRNHPPISSHPPPPIPPPRRPSTDGRMGGKGTNSAMINMPAPIQKMKQATSSQERSSSVYERTMTLPINLPSYPPSNTKLTARSRSPPLSRQNTTSMVYFSNPSRFQTMSIQLPSYATIAPLPPPTRPPNVPLPPVPISTRSFSPSSLSSHTSTSSSSITKDIDYSQDSISPSPSMTGVEFPDDDDLDPDYADELAASRIRSQEIKSTSSSSSSDTAYFSVISDVGNNDYSSVNHHQQLSTSGLTFVMVEETLGDGELVLDIQDVGENHPHVIRSKSSHNNIHNNLIRNDKEKDTNEKNFFNKTILNELNNLEGNSEENEKENLKEEEEETVKELNDEPIKENENLNLEKDDTINNIDKHINTKVISKNGINDVLSSNVTI